MADVQGWKNLQEVIKGGECIDPFAAIILQEALDYCTDLARHKVESAAKIFPKGWEAIPGSSRTLDLIDVINNSLVKARRCGPQELTPLIPEWKPPIVSVTKKAKPPPVEATPLPPKVSKPVEAPVEGVSGTEAQHAWTAVPEFEGRVYNSPGELANVLGFKYQGTSVYHGLPGAAMVKAFNKAGYKVYLDDEHKIERTPDRPGDKAAGKFVVVKVAETPQGLKVAPQKPEPPKPPPKAPPEPGSWPPKGSLSLVYDTEKNIMGVADDKGRWYPDSLPPDTFSRISNYFPALSDVDRDKLAQIWVAHAITGAEPKGTPVQTEPPVKTEEEIALTELQDILDEDKKAASITKLEAFINSHNLSEDEIIGIDEIQGLIDEYKDITREGMTPDEYNEAKADAFEALQDAVGELELAEKEEEEAAPSPAKPVKPVIEAKVVLPVGTKVKDVSGRFWEISGNTDPSNYDVVSPQGARTKLGKGATLEKVGAFPAPPPAVVSAPVTPVLPTISKAQETALKKVVPAKPKSAVTPKTTRLKKVESAMAPESLSEWATKKAAPVYETYEVEMLWPGDTKPEIAVFSNDPAKIKRMTQASTGEPKQIRILPMDNPVAQEIFAKKSKVLNIVAEGKTTKVIVQNIKKVYRPISVDDDVIWHSPYTNEDVVMNFRGYFGDQAMLYNKKSGAQVSVPKDQIRKQENKAITFKGFKTESDVPEYISMMRDPDYYRMEKNEIGRIVYMTPDEYLDKSDALQGVSRWQSSGMIDKAMVHKYADMMKSGA